MKNYYWCTYHGTGHTIVPEPLRCPQWLEAIGAQRDYNEARHMDWLRKQALEAEVGGE